MPENDWISWENPPTTHWSEKTSASRFSLYVAHQGVLPTPACLSGDKRVRLTRVCYLPRLACWVTNMSGSPACVAYPGLPVGWQTCPAHQGVLPTPACLLGDKHVRLTRVCYLPRLACRVTNVSGSPGCVAYPGLPVGWQTCLAHLGVLPTQACLSGDKRVWLTWVCYLPRLACWVTNMSGSPACVAYPGLPVGWQTCPAHQGVLPTPACLSGDKRVWLTWVCYLPRLVCWVTNISGSPACVAYPGLPVGWQTCPAYQRVLPTPVCLSGDKRVWLSRVCYLPWLACWVTNMSGSPACVAYPGLPVGWQTLADTRDGVVSAGTMRTLRCTWWCRSCQRLRGSLATAPPEWHSMPSLTGTTHLFVEVVHLSWRNWPPVKVSGLIPVFCVSTNRHIYWSCWHNYLILFVGNLFTIAVDKNYTFTYIYNNNNNNNNGYF